MLDAKTENRPTANELYQILNKWHSESYNSNMKFILKLENVKKLEKTN